jgi:hypothetical protein
MAEQPCSATRGRSRRKRIGCRDNYRGRGSDFQLRATANVDRLRIGRLTAFAVSARPKRFDSRRPGDVRRRDPEYPVPTRVLCRP